MAKINGQLSLSDLFGDLNNPVTDAQVSVVSVVSVPPVKVVKAALQKPKKAEAGKPRTDIPAELKEIRAQLETIDGFIEFCRDSNYTLRFYGADCYRVYSDLGDKFSLRKYTSGTELRVEDKQIRLYHICDGSLWVIELSFGKNFDPWYCYHNCYCDNKSVYKCSQWAEVRELKGYKNKFCSTWNLITAKEAVIKELEKKNQYLAKWAKEVCTSSQALVIAFYFPFMETLCKAGFEFAKIIMISGFTESTLGYFKKLVHDGTCPDKIFSCTKQIYNILKKETNLEVWDTFRIIEKFDRVPADSLQILYDMNVSKENLKRISAILNASYTEDGKEKKYFSFQSLLAYLGRLDQYEAISQFEALMLLTDYLDMCRQLEMKARVDSDSLKREHDIAARLIRLRYDAIMDGNIKKAVEGYKKYNYSEGIFMVRAIESYDDLLDEAKQQCNCVASYAHKIVNGSSLIFVMREVANPTRSLITIEIGPKGDLRQKYLSHNRPIHNKAQSEFIERWLRIVRANMRAK